MIMHTMRYKIEAFGLSDTGSVRKNNEDAWVALPDLHLYALADGMGGHQSGEVASSQAVSLLSSFVQKHARRWKEHLSFHDMRKAFKEALQHVNSAVYTMSRSSPLLRGMGTTICALYFHSKGLVYAHVGDSRIYRLRDCKLEQLTRDHSLLRELVDQGQLSEAEGKDFPYKNVITQAVGGLHIDPSVHLTDVEIDDAYLVCSDGLSDLLSRKEMETVLNNGTSLSESAHELLGTAIARGGHDNITILLLKVSEP